MEWRLFWALVLLVLAGGATMLVGVLTERFPYP
jgi:hypothetical protein